MKRKTMEKEVIRSPKGYSLMDIKGGSDYSSKNLVFHYRKRSKLGRLLKMRKTLTIKKKSKDFKSIQNNTPRVGSVTILW